MAHSEQAAFVTDVKQRFPAYFERSRVLDVGAHEYNGSTRPLFTDCDYVGIDAMAGPGVDVVTLAHEYRPDKPFDVVISCELLEHDPYWQRTLKMMLDALRPGGLLIITCAGTARPEHGDTMTPQEGYYQNLEPADLLFGLDAARNFSEYSIFQRTVDIQDVYFWGVKR